MKPERSEDASHMRKIRESRLQYGFVSQSTQY